MMSGGSYLGRGGGCMELQVHISHQLPYHLEVAPALAAPLAIPGRQCQILGGHTCNPQDVQIAVPRICKVQYPAFADYSPQGR